VDALLTVTGGYAKAKAVSRQLKVAARVWSQVKVYGIFCCKKVVFNEYFGFPCHSFHRLLHTYHRLSSGDGIISQIMADVLSGTHQMNSVTPRPKYKKKYATVLQSNGQAWDLSLFYWGISRLCQQLCRIICD
jgi:hypothetical protein